LTIGVDRGTKVDNGYRTRNSSGDEVANVNFLYDDIVHVLQNTKFDSSASIP